MNDNGNITITNNNIYFNHKFVTYNVVQLKLNQTQIIKLECH